MKFKLLGAILIGGCLWARAENSQLWENGILLKVTKNTEVFERASSRSKAVADVEEGTPLILRRSSPRALWLEVEDEDGNKGWIAAEKTNYSELKARQLPPKEAKGPKMSDQPLPFDEDENRPPQQKQNLSHELSGIYRSSWVDPSGKRAVAVDYTLFFLEELWNGGETIARAGLSAGYIDYREKKSFALPLRIRYESQRSDSLFYFGPEMGLLWMRRRGGEDHFNFTFAYTTGLIFASRHATIFLRPAFDLFYASRFSLEVGLGLRL